MSDFDKREQGYISQLEDQAVLLAKRRSTRSMPTLENNSTAGSIFGGGRLGRSEWFGRVFADDLPPEVLRFPRM